MVADTGRPRPSCLATARARGASARSGHHRIAKPRVHAWPGRARVPDPGTSAAAMPLSRLRRRLQGNAATIPRRRAALHLMETNQTLAPPASWLMVPNTDVARDLFQSTANISGAGAHRRALRDQRLGPPDRASADAPPIVPGRRCRRADQRLARIMIPATRRPSRPRARPRRAACATVGRTDRPASRSASWRSCPRRRAGAAARAARPRSGCGWS